MSYFAEVITKNKSGLLFPEVLVQHNQCIIANAKLGDMRHMRVTLTDEKAATSDVFFCSVPFQVCIMNAQLLTILCIAVKHNGDAAAI